MLQHLQQGRWYQSTPTHTKAWSTPTLSHSPQKDPSHHILINKAFQQRHIKQARDIPNIQALYLLSPDKQLIAINSIQGARLNINSQTVIQWSPYQYYAIYTTSYHSQYNARKQNAMGSLWGWPVFNTNQNESLSQSMNHILSHNEYWSFKSIYKTNKKIHPIPWHNFFQGNKTWKKPKWFNISIRKGAPQSDSPSRKISTQHKNTLDHSLYQMKTIKYGVVLRFIDDVFKVF